MARPIIEIINCSIPFGEEGHYVKREMNDEEYAALQAKWAVEAEIVANQKPSLEEQVVILTQKIAEMESK